MMKTLLRITFYSLPLLAFTANFTEPRAAVSPVAPSAAVAPAEPLKVMIYKSRGLAFVAKPRPAVNPLALHAARITAQQVRAYVRTQAVERGVNPLLALWIVKHESSYNPRAKGDGEASRGLWQISKIYHPEVSDGMAYSVTGSTRWSLNRIREGKASEWSTYRYCRTLYQDCPF
jgi:hypothetical protein